MFFSIKKLLLSSNNYFPIGRDSLDENYKIPELGNLNLKFLIYTIFLFLYVAYLYFSSDANLPGDSGFSSAVTSTIEEQSAKIQTISSKIPTLDSLVFSEDDVADKYIGDKYLEKEIKKNLIKNIILLTISIFMINICSLVVSECVLNIR